MLYTAAELGSIAGLSYRQLDHWTRIGLVTPRIGARGKGSRRVFDSEDVITLLTIGRLRGLGIPTEVIRGAVSAVRRRGTVRPPFYVVAVDGELSVVAKGELGAHATPDWAVLIPPE